MTKQAGARRPRDQRGGFTLAEVALALAILGLLSAIGLPFLRAGSGVAALRIKTAEVAALLRSERNAALRSGGTSVVLINQDERLVQSQSSRRRVVFPRSMTIDSGRFSQIRFFPNGRSSGGRIALANGKTGAVVSVNGLTAAIEVTEPRQ